MSDTSYLAGARPQAHTDLIAGLVFALLFATVTWSFLDLQATYVVTVGILYVITAYLIASNLPDTLPQPGLGSANRITVARSIGTLCLAGLVTYADSLSTLGRWSIVGLGTGIMLLDGVDPITATLHRIDTIEAFEARDRARRPWAQIPGTGSSTNT